MLQKSSLSLFFALCTCYVFSQSLQFSTMERGIMTRATLSKEHSIYFNPAGLVAQEKQYLGLNYSTRLGLKDLQTINIGYILPLKEHHFALSINQFGNDNYTRRTISLNYARRLFDKLDLGVRFNSIQNQVIEFEDQFQFTFDIGISSQLTDQVRISFYTTNPLQAKLGEQNSYFDMNIGTQWTPTDKASINFEISKNNNFAPLDIRIGFMYSIAQKFDLYGGISTGKTSFGLGIQYQYKKFKILASSNYSYTLGMQPSLGIGAQF